MAADVMVAPLPLLLLPSSKKQHKLHKMALSSMFDLEITLFEDPG